MLLALQVIAYDRTVHACKEVYLLIHGYDHAEVCFDTPGDLLERERMGLFGERFAYLLRVEVMVIESV